VAPLSAGEGPGVRFRQPRFNEAAVYFACADIRMSMTKTRFKHFQQRAKKL
jgi:hypothetical protein